MYFTRREIFDVRYLQVAAREGRLYQSAPARELNDEPAWGAPGNSPMAFERAMAASEEEAERAGEEFDRDAAGRAWFRGRRNLAEEDEQ